MGSSRCFGRLRRASPDARWDFNWAGGCGASHHLERVSLVSPQYTESFVADVTCRRRPLTTSVRSWAWQVLPVPWQPSLSKSEQRKSTTAPGLVEGSHVALSVFTPRGRWPRNPRLFDRRFLKHSCQIAGPVISAPIGLRQNIWALCGRTEDSPIAD
jgi:hypothetical protein